MDTISKRLKIKIPHDQAFRKFVNELNDWWPKECTWSQDKLKEIKIEAREGGLCTEIGPNGFRCDWGAVTEFNENKKIRLKWQISPKRAPIPNIDEASDLSVDFSHADSFTTMKFEHFNFENHGEGSDSYKQMMDSEYGWDYILNKFKDYCEK